MKNYIKISVVILGIIILILFANNNKERYALAEKESNNLEGRSKSIRIDNKKNGVLKKEIGSINKYRVYNKTFYMGDHQKKQVALTFDDGPSQYYTDKVLDILREKEIKATFFLIGKHVQKYPEVVKRIEKEGHQIGNHSWSHKNFKKLSPDQIKEELRKTQKMMDHIIKNQSNIFRPPYGSIEQKTLEIVNDCGYDVVNWSVDTRDWEGIPKEQIISNVKKQLDSGSIILMHCSGRTKAMENMIIALPQIIELIKEEGYEFITISDLLYFEKVN